MLELLETDRGWGVFDTVRSAFVRFLDDSRRELFPARELAWGLALYAGVPQRDEGVAERSLPAWVLFHLPPVAEVQTQAALDLERGAALYEAALRGAMAPYQRASEQALRHAGARSWEGMRTPLVGATAETAVALCYGASGPAEVGLGFVEQALRALGARHLGRLVIYGRSTQTQPPEGARWSFVALDDAERALETRERERGRIISDVALRLPGFEVVGSDGGRLIVGKDARGAVAVVWRDAEALSAVTHADVLTAHEEAQRLGLGTELTIIGVQMAIGPIAQVRFIQVTQQDGHWTPLMGWDALLALPDEAAD